MKTNKKYKSKSIQGQLLYRLSFILIVLLIGLGFYQYKNMKEYLYERKVEFLDSRFKNIDENIILNTNTDILLVKNMTKILDEISTENVCVTIIDKSGEIIATKNRYTGINTGTSKKGINVMGLPLITKREYLENLSESGLSDEYKIIEDTFNKNQIVIWRKIGSVDSPIGLVQISTYIDETNKILIDQAKMYIFSDIAVLIIAIILSLTVLKHTLKPLKNLTNKLDTIDTNQLNIRLEEKSGQIEIDKLSNKFNNMFDRLENSFAKEKRATDKMKKCIT